jgi:hypothetical protein
MKNLYLGRIYLTNPLSSKTSPFVHISNKITHPLQPSRTFIIDFFKLIIEIRRFIIENEDFIIEKTNAVYPYYRSTCDIIEPILLLLNLKGYYQTAPVIIATSKATYPTHSPSPHSSPTTLLKLPPAPARTGVIPPNFWTRLQVHLFFR